MKLLRFTAMIVSLICLAARAETITFEIYAVSSRTPGQLLAKGTKSYTVNDVYSSNEGLIGPQFSSKSIYLTDEFYIGGSIYRERRVDGFGLWVHKTPKWYEIWKGDGFSWEWFDMRQPGNVFRKLQGPGQVKVTFLPTPGYEEIAAVEFLDDVTMRLNDHPWFFFTHEETHHVVIRKGSVLRFSLE